jgi:hypothetical protein
VRIVPALALAGATLAHSLVGDWTSYTKLFGVRDMKEAKGYLFAGTGGGIRRIQPVSKDESVYRNQEGLRDVGINALAVSPAGDVFAASELGFIYGYDAKADYWDLLATSYKGAGWRMNPRAMVYRDGYLLLGSDKGLSFFNVKKKVAEANVTKMGSGTGFSVNSVLFAGDTLFVGTTVGIYRTTLRMDKLLTNPQVNIFNPAIWSLVPGTQGALFFDPEHPEAAPGDTLPAEVDTTRHLPEKPDSKLAHGLLFYGPKGIASEFEGTAVDGDDLTRISRFGNLRVEGKPFQNPYHMQVLAKAGGRWFVGNETGLCEFHVSSGNIVLLTNPHDLPFGEITAVRANRSGTYIWSTPNVFRLNGRIWEPVAQFSVLQDATEAKRRGLHAFDAPAADRFFIGTWGGGFQAKDKTGTKVFDAANSCMETADARDPNFPVIWAMAAYKDKGVWLSSEVYGSTYQLAFYDFAKAELSCFAPVTKEREPRSIDVAGDSVLTVVTERGLEAYRIVDEGGPVRINPANLVPSLPSAPAPTLAGKMDRLGNFWITTEGTELTYIPAIIFHDSARQAFQSLDGFSGTACKSFERDPNGHLWAGCTEGGIFEVTPGRDSLSHSFRRYGLNDGLVSEIIFHLDVNPDNGDVWIVTEKGLSRFESLSRPTQPSLSGVKVYPNPFLPKHAAVVFDKLSAGSELQVTTQSGSVVYHKSLAAGSGDQIRWDGRNQAGHRVREGVYFYVVRSPKETKNGKIIVAR